MVFEGRLHAQHQMAKRNELSGIIRGSLSHNVISGLLLLFK